MRKYDSKNKRNIGIIIGVCIIFAVIFSFFLIKEIKLSKIKYELEASTVLFDIDKNNILLNSIGEIKKKWNKKYYLTYEDEQYNVGTHVIAFNNNRNSLSLYGEFYEVKSNSEVEITKEETILNNLGISKFYKIEDRKYLIIDPNIRTQDESLKTTNYLIVELDKQGNAILYNNSLNVKVFSASKILTTNYTFDIANELLIYENETVDLKKILGTTNEYKEKEEEDNKNPDKENESTTGDGQGGGEGTGTGTGIGNDNQDGTGDNQTGTGNNNGTGGDAGDNSDDDIITDENGPSIGDNEIINQTAYTSIIRLTPSTNSISIDYVIYDKLGKYLNTYVEVKSGNTYNVVTLPKSTTNILLTNLKPGTNYELTFKYKHLDDGLVKEETIDSYDVVTLFPTVTLTGTKVTSKAISYKLTTSSYSIDSAKLRLYINNEKQTNEISVSGNNITGSFNITGIKFPGNAIVELRLEDVIISGVSYNKPVSWSYKTANVVDPEPEPENPTPEPDNPSEPEDPNTPEDPTPPDNPNEENGEGEDNNEE